MLSKKLMTVFSIIALLGGSAARASDSASPELAAIDASMQSNPGPVMDLDEVLAAVVALGGDAAQGLAKVVESVFARAGRPSAVIVGDEVQGAFVVGYRKGHGKFVLPGQAPDQATDIFWAAPSIGLNVGGSASKVAVLVYGAQSRDEVLRRFASIQGSYHFIAGAGVSYLRTKGAGDSLSPLTLAYVTVGVGLDAGIALEAVSFSKESRWF